MRQDMRLKTIVTNIAGVIIAVSILAGIGCGKTIVKREFVMSGSARHQVLVDSLNQQIRDCENALYLQEEAKGRKF